MFMKITEAGEILSEINTMGYGWRALQVHFSNVLCLKFYYDLNILWIVKITEN